MDHTTVDLQRPLALRQILRLSEMGDRYADRWRSGLAPSVESYLCRQYLESIADEVERRELLKCLLQLEVEYRQDRGEPLTPGELKSRFSDYEGIARLLAIEPSEPASDGPTDSTRRAIHERYRVLRFHAQGGLGRVSIAEDRELRREVALKELLDGFIGDPARASRFLFEGEVTGSLEHPGIVPIYGLGWTKEGSPFYAMRLIRGESLKEAIDRVHGLGERDDGPVHDQSTQRGAAKRESRESALRRLFGSFVAACNAVAYAHSRGVIHRDIKPANIMLGPFGETLVVDWGLAKVLDRLSDADDLFRTTIAREGHDETQVGEVKGTPAYMAPEQWAGEPTGVGFRADVYALGATLYAIVTGQSPYEGLDARRLRQLVVNGQAPVRPRDLTSEVSRPLEAVVLKAMATDPQYRYESVEALRSDVERWLADEPVTACRDPLTVRLARWGKRHRTLVSASATGLILGLGGLLAFSVMLDTKNRALAATNVALDKQRTRAEKGEAAAIAAVSQFRDTIVNTPEFLTSEPLQLVRTRLLKQPLAFFTSLKDQLVQSGDNTPDSLDRLAEAIVDLALTTSSLGDERDAVRLLEEAIEVRRTLARQHPKNVTFTTRLAESLNNVADAYRKTGQFETAESSIKEGIQIRESLHSSPFAPPYNLKSLATLHANLGNLNKERGTNASAEVEYKASLILLKELAEKDASDVEYQNSLANCEYNYAQLLGRVGRREEGLRMLAQAESIWKQVIEKHPQVADYKGFLASLYLLKGGLELERQNIEAGVDALRSAILTIEPATKQYPAVIRWQRDLGAAHQQLGLVFRNTGKLEQALQENGMALTINERLVLEYPAARTHRKDFAASLGERAVLLSLSKQPDEALKSFEKVVEVQEMLSRDFPDDARITRDLGTACFNLGIQLHVMGQHPKARESYKRAVALRRTLAERMPDDLALNVDLARALTNYADVLPAGADAALDAYAEALLLFDGFAAAGRREFDGDRDALHRKIETLQRRRSERPQDASADK